MGIQQLYAQEFGETIRTIPHENRPMANFELFKSRNLSDSTVSDHYYGLSIGANISRLTGDAKAANNLIGLRLGGLYGRWFNGHTALQIELAYSKQGSQHDEDSLQTGVLIDSGFTISTKQNYLAVPITIRHYPFNQIGLFVEGGARFAFLLDAELQGTEGSFANTPDDRINITDRINRWDAGIVLGVGYSFLKNIDFSLRYNYNFLNYLKTSHPQTAGGGHFRNRNIQATLGFYLHR